MTDRWVHAIEKAWLAPPRLLLLLLPLEWVFAALTALRRLAYRRGWRKSSQPGVPVVVVGNLLVGGTGKTPVVIALVQSLEESGMRVAVVSRGYGGSYTGVQRVHGHSDAQQVGDEALLIARSIGGPVYVARDRASAAQAAAAEGVGLIVCDDGLQHYALSRDIEVVTIDSDIGFGNGHLLPVGPLREPRRRLASVDFLLERGGQDPFTGLGFKPIRFCRLGSDEVRPLNAPEFATGVHALAAIARPGRFFDTLEELDIPTQTHALKDHEALSNELLASLADKPLLMTSKDAVKCTPDAHPDAWVLEMAVVFPKGFVSALHSRLATLTNDLAPEGAS